MRAAVLLALCLAWCVAIAAAKPVGLQSIPRDTPLRDVPRFFTPEDAAILSTASNFAVESVSATAAAEDFRQALGLLPTKCGVCTTFIHLVNDYIMSNKTLGELEFIAVKLCNNVLDNASKFKGPIVCPGLIAAYTPPVVFIVLQLALVPEDVCTRLQFCSSPAQVKLASSLPVEESEGHRLVSGKVAPAPAPTSASPKADSTKVFRVLQLADMHVDAMYKENTNAHCGKFTCCRESEGPGTAGYWGDYSCDLPIRTISHTLDFISKMDPRPDFIIWTGDNPPHDLSEESEESQLVASSVVGTLLRDHLSDFDIAPSLGNHEGFPANLYYQPTYKWLTDGLAEVWSDWLPADALATFREAGYYTMLVRPGLRIVSMNTQYGYQENFYFILNSDVPAVQKYYDWLNSTLLAAEAAGEKVFLVGHVPPGQPDAIESYGAFHRSIVTRFSKIIIAQTFGHTHLDQFEVIREKTGNTTSGDPVGVAFIAPSLTTYTNLNPTFRVYEFDDATLELLDFKQYYMNMSRANEVAASEMAAGTKPLTPPTFELEYSARDAYGLASMAPSEWMRMSDRMATDDDLLATYFKHRSSSARNDTCDILCRRTIVCMTRSASVDEYALCMGGVHDMPMFAVEGKVDPFAEHLC
eukprot:Opistho-2@42147